MTRQKQRKSVFQMVYAMNYQGVEQKETILEEFYRQHELTEHYEYIDNTFLGICDQLEAIDALIEPSLSNWSMKRLNAVCLAILRLAVFELKFNPDIPDRVAINEAIELAKEFGEADSGGFVHGVLGSIVK